MIHKPFPQIIVTDSNLWLHAAIVGHKYHEKSLDFLRYCVTSEVQLIAPALWEAETDSSLRKMFSLHYINASAAKAALKWIDASPVTIIHHADIRLLARQIADVIQAPRVYDATYAALAQLNDCSLWTADQRFFNAVRNAQDAAVKQRRLLPLPEVCFIATFTGKISA